MSLAQSCASRSITPPGQARKEGAATAALHLAQRPLAPAPHPTPPSAQPPPASARRSSLPELTSHEPQHHHSEQEGLRHAGNCGRARRGERPGGRRSGGAGKCGETNSTPLSGPLRLLKFALLAHKTTLIDAEVRIAQGFALTRTDTYLAARCGWSPSGRRSGPCGRVCWVVFLNRPQGMSGPRRGAGYDLPFLLALSPGRVHAQQEQRSCALYRAQAAAASHLQVFAKHPDPVVVCGASWEAACQSVLRDGTASLWVVPLAATYVDGPPPLDTLLICSQQARRAVQAAQAGLLNPGTPCWQAARPAHAPGARRRPCKVASGSPAHLYTLVSGADCLPYERCTGWRAGVKRGSRRLVPPASGLMAARQCTHRGARRTAPACLFPSLRVSWHCQPDSTPCAQQQWSLGGVRARARASMSVHCSAAALGSPPWGAGQQAVMAAATSTPLSSLQRSSGPAAKGPIVPWQ